MIVQSKTASKTKPTVSGHFVVLNDKGLHTRPATELVKCAMSFRSEITLSYQGLVVNAKSLLGILTLAATKGARILVTANGDDAAEALKKLQEVALNKFYIHY
ncbi:MAG: HPr family phosphocarrier protein [Verrucomicrobia bacterium]|nr:HPr family phosphocarrier protein [Verrucomicrobiota bacterium]MBS0645825.1 HPr family phosphocarrier protein [Verrucomicrobiota bacterium]